MTWPDSFEVAALRFSSVDSCALGKVDRRRMRMTRMMRTKKRKKRRTSRFGFQCFRFSARSFLAAHCEEKVKKKGKEKGKDGKDGKDGGEMLGAQLATSSDPLVLPNRL